jgi:hypothetical protein
LAEGTRSAPGRGWAVGFAAATAIGVFLGLLGPFGSFLNGPFWSLLAYWVALVWLGFAVFGGGTALILRRLGSRPLAWAAIGLFVLAASAPFGLVSWTFATTLWPRLRQTPGLTPLVWYFEGLAITVPQVALFVLLRSRRRALARPTPPAPGLLGAAPAEVLCLQMEDHYVRVHTARGSSLVLATFGQAVAALGGADGLQVHRSWWVAEKAVAGAVAEGRNLRLILTNGLSAPVARSAVAAVRRAGWLARGGAATSDSVVA